MAGVARQSDQEGGDYAPFRDGAASPPSGSGGERVVTEREKPTPEQAIKRITSALERCQAMLTSDVRQAFPKLPDKVRRRFLHAARNCRIGWMIWNSGRKFGEMGEDASAGWPDGNA